MASVPEKKYALWFWSVLLYVPVILFYAAHVYSPLIAQGMKPTMFIAYDMFYYMANAREYYDSHTFHLLYQNPFSASDDSRYLYFQPHIFLLGMLMKLCGDYPGIIFSVFGGIAGIACLRILVGFYHAWAGMDNPPAKILLIVLCWGGGLLSLSGIIYQVGQGHDLAYAYQNSAIFDPFDGWWFLNFGRNLLYPTEAYYHAVFIGAVFALYARRHVLYLALVFLLAASHPFTGTELLLISLVYFFIERFFIRNAEYPSYVFWCLIGIALIHYGYYLVYLMRDPDHYSLATQWARDWRLGIISMIFAYGLYGALFVANIRSLAKVKKYFSCSFNRFLLVWFLTALLLANHELFLDRPMQPLHFTRGYIWLSLFLMGFPLMVKFISVLWEKKYHRYFTVPVLAIVLLSDNLLWLPLKAKEISLNPYIYTTPEVDNLFSELKKDQYRSCLVIANDQRIGYWITVYTPLRSWFSHDFNTPFAAARARDVQQFFTAGRVTAAWEGRKVLVVLNKHPGYNVTIEKELTTMNKEYESKNLLVYSGRW